MASIEAIRNCIKYWITKVEMTLLKILWIFPMNNSEILFLSYDGKQYSDSPLCLSQRIKEKAPEKRIIWALKDVTMANMKEVDKVINRDSLLYIYHVCTAGTIISNNGISSFLPIRKKQILLNTWHGGSPTKTVGFREARPSAYYRYYFHIQDMKTTAIISSSRFFTKEVIEESFGFEHAEIIESGLPRNDILLNNHQMITEKVYKYFGIENNGKNAIVLYAPTFRGDVNHSSFLQTENMLPVEKCLKVLNAVFKKEFVFLFRAHHAMSYSSLPGSINATDYPDMQDLLCAADVLITDYSSCMHDFALMKNPIFLYVPDYETYMQDRGFYWDIPTMPFPYAKSIDEFIALISKFNLITYRENIDNYFAQLGNFENGTATNRVFEWLKEKWRMQLDCS